MILDFGFIKMGTLIVLLLLVPLHLTDTIHFKTGRKNVRNYRPVLKPQLYPFHFKPVRPYRKATIGQSIPIGGFKRIWHRNKPYHIRGQNNLRQPLNARISPFKRMNGDFSFNRALRGRHYSKNNLIKNTNQVARFRSRNNLLKSILKNTRPTSRITVNNHKNNLYVDLKSRYRNYRHKGQLFGFNDGDFIKRRRRGGTNHLSQNRTKVTRSWIHERKPKGINTEQKFGDLHVTPGVARGGWPSEPRSIYFEQQFANGYKPTDESKEGLFGKYYRDTRDVNSEENVGGSQAPYALDEVDIRRKRSLRRTGMTDTIHFKTGRKNVRNYRPVLKPQLYPFHFKPVRPYRKATIGQSIPIGGFKRIWHRNKPYHIRGQNNLRLPLNARISPFKRINDLSFNRALRGRHLSFNRALRGRHYSKNNLIKNTNQVARFRSRNNLLKSILKNTRPTSGITVNNHKNNLYVNVKSRYRNYRKEGQLFGFNDGDFIKRRRRGGTNHLSQNRTKVARSWIHERKPKGINTEQKFGDLHVTPGVANGGWPSEPRSIYFEQQFANGYKPTDESKEGLFGKYYRDTRDVNSEENVGGSQAPYAFDEVDIRRKRSLRRTGMCGTRNVFLHRNSFPQQNQRNGFKESSRVPYYQTNCQGSNYMYPKENYADTTVGYNNRNNDNSGYEVDSNTGLYARYRYENPENRYEDDPDDLSLAFENEKEENYYGYQPNDSGASDFETKYNEYPSTMTMNEKVREPGKAKISGNARSGYSKETDLKASALNDKYMLSEEDDEEENDYGHDNVNNYQEGASKLSDELKKILELLADDFAKLNNEINSNNYDENGEANPEITINFPTTDGNIKELDNELGLLVEDDFAKPKSHRKHHRKHYENKEYDNPNSVQSPTEDDFAKPKSHRKHHRKHYKNKEFDNPNPIQSPIEDDFRSEPSNRYELLDEMDVPKRKSHSKHHKKHKKRKNSHKKHSKHSKKKYSSKQRHTRYGGYEDFDQENEGVYTSLDNQFASSNSVDLGEIPDIKSIESPRHSDAAKEPIRPENQVETISSTLHGPAIARSYMPDIIPHSINRPKQTLVNQASSEDNKNPYRNSNDLTEISLDSGRVKLSPLQNGGNIPTAEDFNNLHGNHHDYQSGPTYGHYVIGRKKHRKIKLDRSSPPQGVFQSINTEKKIRRDVINTSNYAHKNNEQIMTAAVLRNDSTGSHSDRNGFNDRVSKSKRHLDSSIQDDSYNKNKMGNKDNSNEDSPITNETFLMNKTASINNFVSHETISNHNGDAVPSVSGQTTVIAQKDQGNNLNEFAGKRNVLLATSVENRSVNKNIRKVQIVRDQKHPKMSEWQGENTDFSKNIVKRIATYKPGNRFQKEENNSNEIKANNVSFLLGVADDNQSLSKAQDSSRDAEKSAFNEVTHNETSSFDSSNTFTDSNNDNDDLYNDIKNDKTIVKTKREARIPGETISPESLKYSLNGYYNGIVKRRNENETSYNQSINNRDNPSDKQVTDKDNGHFKSIINATINEGVYSNGNNTNYNNFISNQQNFNKRNADIATNNVSMIPQTDSTGNDSSYYQFTSNRNNTQNEQNIVDSINGDLQSINNITSNEKLLSGTTSMGNHNSNSSLFSNSDNQFKITTDGDIGRNESIENKATNGDTLPVTDIIGDKGDYIETTKDLYDEGTLLYLITNDSDSGYYVFMKNKSKEYIPLGEKDVSSQAIIKINNAFTIFPLKRSADSHRSVSAEIMKKNNQLVNDVGAIVSNSQTTGEMKGTVGTTFKFSTNRSTNIQANITNRTIYEHSYPKRRNEHGYPKRSNERSDNGEVSLKDYDAEGDNILMTEMHSRDDKNQNNTENDEFNERLNVTMEWLSNDLNTTVNNEDAGDGSDTNSNFTFFSEVPILEDNQPARQDSFSNEDEQNDFKTQANESDSKKNLDQKNSPYLPEIESVRNSANQTGVGSKSPTGSSLSKINKNKRSHRAYTENKSSNENTEGAVSGILLVRNSTRSNESITNGTASNVIDSSDRNHSDNKNYPARNNNIIRNKTENIDSASNTSIYTNKSRGIGEFRLQDEKHFSRDKDVAIGPANISEPDDSDLSRDNAAEANLKRIYRENRKSSENNTNCTDGGKGCDRTSLKSSLGTYASAHNTKRKERETAEKINKKKQIIPKQRKFRKLRKENCVGGQCFTSPKLSSKSNLDMSFHVNWDKIYCGGWKELIDVYGEGSLELGSGKRGKHSKKEGTFFFDIKIARSNRSHQLFTKGCEYACAGRPGKLVIKGEKKTLRTDNKYYSKVLSFISGDAVDVWEPFQMEIMSPGSDCHKRNTPFKIRLDGSDDGLSVMKLVFLEQNKSGSSVNFARKPKGEKKPKKTGSVTAMLKSIIERTKKSKSANRLNKRGLYTNASARRCPRYKARSNSVDRGHSWLHSNGPDFKEQTIVTSRSPAVNAKIEFFKMFGQFQCRLGSGCQRGGTTRFLECTLLDISMLNEANAKDQFKNNLRDLTT